MKKFRLRTLFTYLMAVLCGSLLLHTSQNVQKEEEKLAAINASVEQEKESIRVLKTEWAYLNNPERLEALAKQYLGLSAASPDQVKTENSEIPAKVEPPPSAPILEAQPVSYTPQPSPPKPSIKPFPKPIPKIIPLKTPPKEKDFDTLLKQVAEEGPE